MAKGFRGTEIDFIPDRLIEEPVVFRGLTDSEVVGVAAVSLAIWVPLSTLFMSFFGLAIFGLGIGFGVAIISLLLIAKYLNTIKRRMPDGLHIVYLKKRAQEVFKIVDFGYIDRSGRWDVRRTGKI